MFSKAALCLVILCVALTESCHPYRPSYRAKQAPKSWWNSYASDATEKPERTFLGQPDGNQYDYGTETCESYRQLWQDPSIPIESRNQIGRGIFLNGEKLRMAMKEIRLCKSYQLGIEYTMTQPNFGDRFVNTSLACFNFTLPNKPKVGFCQQSFQTNAIDNVGTQLDVMAHAYNIDSAGNMVFFNNFRMPDVYAPWGHKALSGTQWPPIFTRAILLDVARYLSKVRLPNAYKITVEDIRGTLMFQGLTKEVFTPGDAVLIRTGFGKTAKTDPDNFFGAVPGITWDVVEEYFYYSGVLLLGSDTGTVEWWNTADPAHTAKVHRMWIPCAGGIIHEALDLEEWAEDARMGDAPYVGAYNFNILKVRGIGGSIGTPVVFV